MFFALSFHLELPCPFSTPAATKRERNDASFSIQTIEEEFVIGVGAHSSTSRIIVQIDAVKIAAHYLDNGCSYVPQHLAHLFALDLGLPRVRVAVFARAGRVQRKPCRLAQQRRAFVARPGPRMPFCFVGILRGVQSLEPIVKLL